MNSNKKIFNDALKLHQNGEIKKAQKLYLELINIYKNNDKLYFLLGTSFLQTKNFIKAIEFLSLSIKINNNFADSFNNRGIALAEIEKHSEALNDYDQAIKLKPNFFSANLNKAIALKNLKNFDQATRLFKICISLNPNNSQVYNNLGNLYKESLLNEKAIVCYKKAVELNPNYPEALNNLAITYQALGKFKEAQINYNKAFEINENIEYLPGNRFYNNQFICDWKNFEKKIDEIKIGIDNNKNLIDPFILLGILDDPVYHKINAEIHIKKKFNRISTKAIEKNSNKKIKIAYFSAEYHRHPILLLMMDIFKNHNKSLFEVFAFSHGPYKEDDPWRQLVKPYFNEFFDITTKASDEILYLCRKLKIDIAVNLTGLTANNRTEIFMDRVAPIQINYLGYPGTMGAKFMDYIIADKIIIPENLKNHYSEKVLYLPDCYQPNTRNLFTKKIEKKNFTRVDFDLPKEAVILCSFNSNYKITPTIFNSWMNILKKVKSSVLWIYAYNDIAKNNLKIEAKRRGIDSNRIFFAEKMPILEEHFERMKLADIFLDTFPYGAHTTAGDCLRVALPIVTLMGNSFASRVAASILASIDMKELITHNIIDYENLIIKLASDKNELNKIKNKMKEKIEQSSFFNSLKFTKELEKIYLNLINK